jgi:hypothetical protein
VASTPGAPVLDPQLSPDGTMLAYVRGDELHVTPSTSGEAKQLTFGAGGQGKVSAAGNANVFGTSLVGSSCLMGCAVGGKEYKVVDNLSAN